MKPFHQTCLTFWGSAMKKKNAGQLLLNEHVAMNLGQLWSLSKGWFPNLKLPFTSWGQVIRCDKYHSRRHTLKRFDSASVSTNNFYYLISENHTKPLCWRFSRPCISSPRMEAMPSAISLACSCVSASPMDFFWWSDVQKIEAKYLHTVLCSIVFSSNLHISHHFSKLQTCSAPWNSCVVYQ